MSILYKRYLVSLGINEIKFKTFIPCRASASADMDEASGLSLKKTAEKGHYKKRAVFAY